MRYKPFRDDIKLSKLGLGAMRLPQIEPGFAVPEYPHVYKGNGGAASLSGNPCRDRNILRAFCYTA